MFEEFQALAALKKYGTLAIAGAHLRVEASTVWKRIQSLERLSGKKLLEKRGRNAYLTPQAENILLHSQSHVEALKEILTGYSDTESPVIRPLRVGLSESIALSWGPKLLKELLSIKSNVKFELSTHRGSLLIEKLQHGDFDFIVCAGNNNPKTSLVGELLFEEELLFYKNSKSKTIYCIEESALSFEWLKDEVNSALDPLRRKNDIASLQSYGAIASLISADIAGGIVPYGVAKRFQLPNDQLTKMSKKIHRSIYLYSKKNFYTSKIGNDIFKKAKEIGKDGNKKLLAFTKDGF